MISRQGFAFAVLAACVCGIASGDNAENPAGFKSLAAREATITSANALRRLVKEYEEKKASAAKTYAAALNAAKLTATKNGDLEDAVRIRDAISKIDPPGAPAGVEPAGEVLEGRIRLRERRDAMERLPGTVKELHALDRRRGRRCF